MKPLAFLFALTLSACQLLGPDGSASDRVVLEASFDAINREVDLRLINRSSFEVGYNLCPTSVRETTTDRSLYGEDVICTMELRLLRPGQSADGRLPIDADSALVPGSYRAHARVSVNEESRIVTSDPFTIP